MIRILHFADLHLGVENYGRVDPETGLSSRVRDFLDRLDEVASYAVDEEVDVVVFAGDAFRNRRPDPTYQRDFARRIARIAREGVAVVLVAGNHDLPTMLVKATTVDIFRALDVENVFVSARKEQIFHIPLSGDRELQVCTFPYPLRSRLLVSEEHRRKPLREQEEFLRAQVAQDLAQLAGQVDRDVPAVLVGHMMVLGAEFGSEQRMFLGSELEALIGAVAHPAYDAVLLGHVHRAQALRSEGPPVLYAGSLERVDFGDEGLEKGFYVVDIEEGPAGQRKVGYRFVPVTARPFLTLEVDALKGEPMERVLKTIEKARQEGKLEDAVLRVHLKVRQEDAALVDVPALRRALSDAFFVAAIAVNVDRPERVAFRGALDQLDPLEALERYWIARGVSAKRREVLTRYAQELIEGEE